MPTSPYKPIWVIFFVLLGIALVVGVSRWHSVATGPEVVPWKSDFAAAREQSVRENKPILLYFTASWCGPCQTMKRTTWADPRVAAALTPYIPVRIDIDEHSDLANQFGVNGIPRVELVAPDTSRQTLLEGLMTPDEFLERVKEVAGK